MLHLDEAVASKVAALLGRALARDYIDVAAAADRYSRRQLLKLTYQRDPGLQVFDPALAAQRLDRPPDAQLSRYRLAQHEAIAVHARFAGWPRDPPSTRTASQPAAT